VSWARLDDAYCDHPKVLRAWNRSPHAIGLHAMAITYCARHQTDGRIPIEWLEQKMPNKRDRTAALGVLVDCALLELHDGEYVVHDFLDYNASNEDIAAATAELSAKRSAAGKRGARARWQTDGKPMANANGTPVAKLSAVPIAENASHPIPSHTNPPSPPAGGRQRDRAQYDDDVANYATSLLPDEPAAAATAAVRAALSLLQHSGLTLSEDGVRAEAVYWLGKDTTGLPEDQRERHRELARRDAGDIA
jgi:hypothetical protein